MSFNEDKSILNKYVTLCLDKEYFALGIASVREILEFDEVTHIPQTPKYMRGVVNLRGTPVPVIDLKMKFGLSMTEKTINTRVIIMEVLSGEEKLTLGLIADAVKEVVEIDASNIDPPPKLSGASNAKFLLGIAKHEGKFIMLLDIDRVFSEQEMEQLTDETQSAMAPGAATEETEDVVEEDVVA